MTLFQYPYQQNMFMKKNKKKYYDYKMKTAHNLEP